MEGRATPPRRRSDRGREPDRPRPQDHARDAGVRRLGSSRRRRRSSIRAKRSDCSTSCARTSRSRATRDGSSASASATSDPQRTYKVANKLAEIYLRESDAGKERESREAFDFIDRQVKEYGDKLTDIHEKVLAQYRGRDAQVGAPDAARRPSARRSRRSRRRSWPACAPKKRCCRRRSRASRRRRPKVDCARTRSSRARACSSCRAISTGCRSNFTDEHPDVKRVKRELAGAQDELARRGARVGRPRRLDAARRQARRRRGARRRGCASTKCAAASPPPPARRCATRRSVRRRTRATPTPSIPRCAASVATPRLSELLRRYEATRDVYQDLLKRRENARVSMELDAQHRGFNLRIQEPAELPAIGVEPAPHVRRDDRDLRGAARAARDSCRHRALRSRRAQRRSRSAPGAAARQHRYAPSQREKSRVRNREHPGGADGRRRRSSSTSPSSSIKLKTTHERAAGGWQPRRRRRPPRRRRQASAPTVTDRRTWPTPPSTVRPPRARAAPCLTRRGQILVPDSALPQASPTRLPVGHGHRPSRSTASASCARACWRWRTASGLRTSRRWWCRWRPIRAPASSRATWPRRSRCRTSRWPCSSTATCAIRRSTWRSARAPTTAASSTSSSSRTRAIDSLVRPTGIPGLHFIPAGHPPTPPREYFASAPMRMLMTALRTEPCYVFLDGPPRQGRAGRANPLRPRRFRRAGRWAMARRRPRRSPQTAALFDPANSPAWSSTSALTEPLTVRLYRVKDT